MPVRFANTVCGSFVLNDGNDIPKIGFGTSQIRDQETLITAVRAALKAGYRMFDTAERYENEEILGNAIQETLPEFKLKREDVFITTKVQIKNGETASHVEDSVKASLEKLRTTYLDLVLVHYPRDRYTGHDDDERNEEERKIAWLKLEELHGRGLIRSLGVSNYDVYHLDEMKAYAKIKPVLDQNEYHPYLTQKLLLRYCKKNGIIFQAYSSLCARSQVISIPADRNGHLIAEEPVEQAARNHSVSVQTILYAFGLCSDAVIIPKSATPSRIESNMADVLKVKLTPHEMQTIRQLDQHITAQASRCI